MLEDSVTMVKFHIFSEAVIYTVRKNFMNNKDILYKKLLKLFLEWTFNNKLPKIEGSILNHFPMINIVKRINLQVSWD